VLPDVKSYYAVFLTLLPAQQLLDGGGAAPLKENKPANDETSEQYFLITHLYQFFGSLLGCTMQGMPGFDAYTSEPSMFNVHKFMNLNHAENTYFIQQVGLSAASFGVAEEDVKAVGTALTTLFNVRCGPPTEVIKGQGPQLQSICIDEETCPLAKDATCPAVPSSGTSTMTATATATGSKTATGTSKPTGTEEPTTVPTAGAAIHGMSIAALAAGVAAPQARRALPTPGRGTSSPQILLMASARTGGDDRKQKRRETK